MSTFIGYTVGLEANRGPDLGKMVKIEYSRMHSQSVKLQAVSGNNLSAMKGSKVITEEEFKSRPQGKDSKVAEARWALSLCGWSLMADDFANRE